MQNFPETTIDLLISPYWNVNPQKAGLSGAGTAFNLSILECKFQFGTLGTLGTHLLISPYWNVNMCKSALPLLLKSLLISPYWNVNKKMPEVNISADKLLISPYWNVNTKTLRKWDFMKYF